jgi:predicted metal-dependent enzyme (double-stranded beta helix superfamily)
MLRMTTTALDSLLQRATHVSAGQVEPADCVLALAPVMMELVAAAPTFLQPRHRAGNAAQYTRNLIHEAADGSLSLYAIVWQPGQWTPVHDHGSWGVVGVVEGVLEERSWVRLSPDRGADEGIELVRGGVILLAPGAVTSFVPNPDHIHMTGVPSERPAALSLHLYGRAMNDFNTYDVAAGTRRRVRVAHNES